MSCSFQNGPRRVAFFSLLLLLLTAAAEADLDSLDLVFYPVGGEGVCTTFWFLNIGGTTQTLNLHFGTGSSASFEIVEEAATKGKDALLFGTLHDGTRETSLQMTNLSKKRAKVTASFFDEFENLIRRRKLKIPRWGTSLLSLSPEITVANVIAHVEVRNKKAVVAADLIEEEPGLSDHIDVVPASAPASPMPSETSS